MVSCIRRSSAIAQTSRIHERGHSMGERAAKLCGARVGACRNWRTTCMARAGPRRGETTCRVGNAIANEKRCENDDIDRRGPKQQHKGGHHKGKVESSVHQLSAIARTAHSYDHPLQTRAHQRRQCTQLLLRHMCNGCKEKHEPNEEKRDCEPCRPVVMRKQHQRRCHCRATPNVRQLATQHCWHKPSTREHGKQFKLSDDHAKDHSYAKASLT
mmetsp:Transcript_9419/g.15667  ORF Transcript_9419/g.15667 Transcript_9419/m.15667 type:complete len:214 (-) Transcript_9419:72-713(-)